jgi:hypothetical protein
MPHAKIKMTYAAGATTTIGIGISGPFGNGGPNSGMIAPHPAVF